MSTERFQGGRGRDKAILAIDIGGTSLKGALFGRSGAVASRISAPTFAPGQDALEGLLGLIEELNRAGARDGLQTTAIGLASPGLVDSDAGTVVYAANLRWRELELRSLLEDRFGLPVWIEHDARSGAIAERANRAGDDDYRNFIFVPIGTGVSAAIVASGVLVTGASGASGEFGHIPVIQGGEPCVCGQRGCLEAYASARSIQVRYRRQGGTCAHSAEGISSSVGVDAIAAAVWSDAVGALAIGITSLVALLDPSVVVIAGGLSRAGATLLAPLRTAVDERLAWRKAPPVVRSELGTHGGLIGAAVLAGEGSDLPSDFSRVARMTLEAVPNAWSETAGRKTAR